MFLVLVCLFYLSFTYISNKLREQGRTVRTWESGNNDDAAYNQAYKHYMDSLGEHKVYLGYYTLNDVRKWGVGLGLDLKGGMNVILSGGHARHAPLHESRRHRQRVFERALAAPTSCVTSHRSDDFVSSFIESYREQRPQADFGVVFQE